MDGVVVGVGRSGDTRAAVRWASAEAALRSWPLTLVHAWEAATVVSVPVGPECLPDLVESATSRALCGAPAPVLLAQDAALLVLGRHAPTSRLSRVTRVCLQHAGCPVVVVPHEQTAPRGSVVVGVSGSSGSLDALRWAADAAFRRSAPLVLVHVWQVHPTSVRDAGWRKARAFHQEVAVERVRRWSVALAGTLDVHIDARRGAPTDVLLAASDGAALLVVGRHTHTGLARIVHGTVALDLGGLSACPVAMIPAPSTPEDPRK